MKLSLTNVTLICVTGVNYDESIYALWKSYKKINFGSVKLISPTVPKSIPKTIKHEFSEGTQLDSIDEYNKYVIYELWRHIGTEYCLLVQADGYVINSKSWNDSFLKYDYVGAPWPISKEAYIDPFGTHQRVGNGGFSLRSSKLLRVPTVIDVPWDTKSGEFFKHSGNNLLSEDGNICIHNRHIFESLGCTWAPLEVALDFSVEIKVNEFQNQKTFGFHKTFPNRIMYIKEKISLNLWKLFRNYS
jgi:hypothetical protein